MSSSSRDMMQPTRGCPSFIVSKLQTFMTQIYLHTGQQLPQFEMVRSVTQFELTRNYPYTTTPHTHSCTIKHTGNYCIWWYRYFQFAGASFTHLKKLDITARHYIMSILRALYHLRKLTNACSIHTITFNV